MSQNLLCKFFGHKFSKWDYVADNSCEQLQVCKRDGYEERRVRHQFSKWDYVADNSCEQLRVCKRDGYEERRVRHQFSKWNYVADNSCEQLRVCARCHFEGSRIAHPDFRVRTWQEIVGWITIKGATYDIVEEWQEKVCTKCGYTDKVKIREGYQ